MVDFKTRLRKPKDTLWLGAKVERVVRVFSKHTQNMWYWRTYFVDCPYTLTSYPTQERPFHPGDLLNILVTYSEGSNDRIFPHVKFVEKSA